MTTDTLLLARDRRTVKATLVGSFTEVVDGLLSAAEAPGAKPRDLEKAMWAGLLPVARTLLTVSWGLLCRRASEADIERRGLRRDQVRLRLDEDYWSTVNSTAGPVPVPLFAYREDRGVSSTTRVPARAEVFALHSKVRSSELCLEWETRLGSRMPFQEAEQLLGFFTHGAVGIADNSINAHMTAIGGIVDPDWLYRPPEEIREILRTRAMRDFKTDKPVVYLSTDAHALRQLTDETWTPHWKMANGIRVWCIDRRTGAVVHLGGEYTWGDCHERVLLVSIGELFYIEHLAIEQKIVGTEAHLALRQERSAPVVEQIFATIEREVGRFEPRTSIAKAMRYMLNQRVPQILEPQTATDQDRLRLAVTLSNYGVMLRKLGDLSGAEDQYHRALLLYESIDDDDGGYASTLNNLAALHHAQGDTAGALSLRGLVVGFSPREGISASSGRCGSTSGLQTGLRPVVRRHRHFETFSIM